MKKSLTLICIAMLCADAQAQTVFKCGNTYQQLPCDGHGTGAMKVRPGKGMEPALRRHVRSQGLSDVEFNKFFVLRKPAIGMSEAQLRKVMGNPKKINANNYQGNQHDQWIFEKGNDRYYVYVDDGIVSSIQHRPDEAAIFRPPKRECATELQIRNARVAANSITISPKEREEKQAEVKRLEGLERCV